MALGEQLSYLFSLHLTSHVTRAGLCMAYHDVSLHHRFPVTLTMAHLTFGFVTLAPVMTLPYFASKHSATLRQHWKGVSCVAAFKVLLHM